MRKVNKWMSLLLFLFVFAVCQSYKKARLSSFYHLLDYSCYTFLLSLGLKIGLF